MNIVNKFITLRKKKIQTPKAILLKMLLSSVTAAALVVSPTATVYAKTDIKGLTSELEIMTNIMRTALAQGSQNNAYKVRKLDVTYLAGQGVVFDVTTSSGGRNMFFEIENMHHLVAPPIPPVPPIGGEDREFIIEFDNDNWQESVEEAVEHAHEVMEHAREQLRDLRDKERDFAWQQRDAQRKLRDIEFEMRNADKTRSVELKEQQKQLEKDMAKLESQQREVEKVAEKLEQEQKQKAAQKREVQKQQHEAFVTLFESNVSSTLCKYGNGLAALDENEHVSFVLANFAHSERSNRQDRIYVFDNKDIQSCVKDKLTAKQLLAKSESYNF